MRNVASIALVRRSPWLLRRSDEPSAPLVISAPRGYGARRMAAYHGDLRNHHYSPLEQINATELQQLEVAWRFKTDSLGRGPSSSWKARR